MIACRVCLADPSVPPICPSLTTGNIFDHRKLKDTLQYTLLDTAVHYFGPSAVHSVGHCRTLCSTLCWTLQYTFLNTLRDEEPLAAKTVAAMASSLE